MRNIFAAIGLTTVLIGVGVWQFGFFSDKVKEVSTQIERETAVARAEAMVRDTEQRAEELSEKARKLRVEARTREIAAERENEKLEKTRKAMTALASAAREAGLPKPSEAGEEHLSQTLVFAGRTLTGAEVYRTLERWQADWRRGERKREMTETMIDRIRSAADVLETKQQKLLVSVGEVRSKLDELAMQRDLAQVEKDLAELGANIRGDFAGDLGKAMDTLQTQIDELQATTEMLAQPSAPGTDLTPDEALTAQAIDDSTPSELDALWENEKEAE